MSLVYPFHKWRMRVKVMGRFSAWLNSDIHKLTEVLNIVKQNGVSPAFFASYEATEGYNSKWGLAESYNATG